MSLGFERKRYADIIRSMEQRARELFGQDIDLSERSPLGLFLQAVAWEIGEAWAEIENSYLNGSALNAEGPALDAIVSNFGRSRFLGSKAKGLVVFSSEQSVSIDEGAVVATADGLRYRTLGAVQLSANGSAEAVVEAEQVGVEYNIPPNAIEKLISPRRSGVTVTNPEAIEGGTDVESDMALRTRHLEALRSPITGDNAAQYYLWAIETGLVGDARVLPTTPEPGHVTIIITDINMGPADQGLLDEVFARIDILRPVNVALHVESATVKTIDVSADVRIGAGYDLDTIRGQFTSRVEEYLRNIGLGRRYVSLAEVGRLLLDTEGVIDYEGLQLNGASANPELGPYEIPVLGTMTLETVE